MSEKRENGYHFYTTAMVARYCGVTSDAVLKWIRAGTLKTFTTPGGHYRISPEDFRSFLESNKMPIDEELLLSCVSAKILYIRNRSVNNPSVAALRETYGAEKVFSTANTYEACILVGKHQPCLIFVEAPEVSISIVNMCKAFHLELPAAKIIVLTVSNVSNVRLYDAGVNEVHRLLNPTHVRDVAKRLML